MNKENRSLNKTLSGKISAVTITSLENWNGFIVNSTTELVVLVAESEGNVGDGETTCTLQQKGNNYEQAEEDKEKIDYRQKVLVYSNEFVDGAYFDLTSNNQMRTDRSYGSIKSAQTLIPRQLKLNIVIFLSIVPLYLGLTKMVNI